MVCLWIINLCKRFGDTQHIKFSSFKCPELLAYILILRLKLKVKNDLIKPTGLQYCNVAIEFFSFFCKVISKQIVQ